MGTGNGRNGGSFSQVQKLGISNASTGIASTHIGKFILKNTERLLYVLAFFISGIFSEAQNGPPKSSAGRLSVGLKVTEYAPGDDSARFRFPTHIAFGPGDCEVITDLKNNRFLFREGPKNPFKVSPVPVRGAHSIVYNPTDKLYYANDTENHRIIAFADLSQKTIQAKTMRIAGIPLNRPHDVVLDSAAGWIYAINPKSGHVVRFTGIGKNESAIKVPLQGYARALTFTDGKLYVIGSAKGRIVEIVDWDTPTFKIYDSYDSTGRQGSAGSWATTGLVLNDAEFYKGYWYASSFFTKFHAKDSDYDENKFIRFKTFDDLNKGKWTDLSEMLPSGMTPYYLTVNQGKLYLAIFNHEVPGKGDSILQITPRLR